MTKRVEAMPVETMDDEHIGALLAADLAADGVQLDADNDGRAGAAPKVETRRALPSKSRFEFVDLTQKLTPIDYLIESLDIAAGAPTLFAGQGYAGKTIAVQQMAVELVLGKPVWGKFWGRDSRTLRVLHIDCEQGMRLTLSRYQRIARAMGVDLATIADRLRVTCFPQLAFNAPNVADVLAFESEKFDLVVLDSLRAVCVGIDENSSAARAPLDLCGKVSEKIGAVFAWIHHARKPGFAKMGPGPEIAAFNSIRGSGAIFEACSSVVMLTASKGEATRVQHEKARNSGRLASDFLLRIEDVQTDDGDPCGGLRVVHREPPARPPPKSLADAHEERMAAIVSFLRRDGAHNRDHVLSRVGKSDRYVDAWRELVRDGKIVAESDKSGRFRIAVP